MAFGGNGNSHECAGGFNRVFAHARFPRKQRRIRRIALATSVASARVGRSSFIIENNISVAVMTGLPAALERLMIFFWIKAISSIGVVIPKSPRATIISRLNEFAHPVQCFRALNLHNDRDVGTAAADKFPKIIFFPGGGGERLRDPIHSLFDSKPDIVAIFGGGQLDRGDPART
jgi:hypothetical protein